MNRELESSNDIRSKDLKEVKVIKNVNKPFTMEIENSNKKRLFKIKYSYPIQREATKILYDNRTKCIENPTKKKSNENESFNDKPEKTLEIKQLSENENYSGSRAKETENPSSNLENRRAKPSSFQDSNETSRIDFQVKVKNSLGDSKVDLSQINYEKSKTQELVSKADGKVNAERFSPPKERKSNHKS